MNEGFYSKYLSTGAENEPGAEEDELPVEILYEDPDSEDFLCTNATATVDNTFRPDNCGRPGMRTAQLNEAKRIITSFEDKLKALEEDDDLSELGAEIDLPSFVDYFLFTELTKNPDGYRHSTYFFKDKPGSKDGDKLTMGPVWDYNIAFR